jgi:hypothetical protein
MGLLEDLEVEKILRDGDRVSKRVPRKAPRDGRLVVVAFLDKAMAKSSMAAAKLAGMSCFCFSAPEGAVLFASADEGRLDDVVSGIMDNYTYKDPEMAEAR